MTHLMHSHFFPNRNVNVRYYLPIYMDVYFYVCIYTYVCTYYTKISFIKFGNIIPRTFIVINDCNYRVQYVSQSIMFCFCLFYWCC